MPSFWPGADIAWPGPDGLGSRTNFGLLAGDKESAMRKLSLCAVSLVLAVALGACSPQIQQPVTATLQLSSATVVAGKIPDKSDGCKGHGVSPQISWTDPPPGTKTFALIMDDQDAIIGHLRRHYFVHWLAFDLSPDRRELVEGFPKQSLSDDERQGRSDVGVLDYSGPCPDEGSTHHYAITVYALDTKLGLPMGTDGRQLLGAIDGHILARGQIIGTYTH
jgi:Raf kinase inhibitor-like YbhB/YbcL family protein